jgi:hypothetical protein
MWSGKWAARVACGAIFVLGAASMAQAQVVTFSEITDAVPSKFFDAARTAPAAFNANKLAIGLHRGMNWTLMKATDFKASTAAYSYTTAHDTISFTAKAPAGFYIAKITYTQRGTGSVVRTGKAAGAASWVVDGVATNLGSFGSNPTLSRTIDLTRKKLTEVPVSITTSLFAFATPSLGSATITLTSADVVVYLLPLT